jgi:hypothetical protein
LNCFAFNKIIFHSDKSFISFSKEVEDFSLSAINRYDLVAQHLNVDTNET